METLLVVQLSIQACSVPTVLQCINQHVGHSVGHSYLLCNNCWSFSWAFSHTPKLTHNIEVIMCIVCNHNVCCIHHPVMTNPVFLQGLRIQDGDLQGPHTRDSIQYYLITPEIPPEQQA